jgi:urease accessory protein
MKRDADKMRDSGPTLFTSVKQGTGIDAVAEFIEAAWKASGASKQ